MQHAELKARIDALEAQLAQRLHLSGRSGLPALLRAARGRLPRRALQEARELVTVRAMLAAPGASGSIDATRAAQTCAMLERHLAAVPEGKYRRRARSALWGGIALQILLVLIGLVVLLRWRGFI